MASPPANARFFGDVFLLSVASVWDCSPPGNSSRCFFHVEESVEKQLDGLLRALDRAQGHVKWGRPLGATCRYGRIMPDPILIVRKRDPPADDLQDAFVALIVRILVVVRRMPAPGVGLLRRLPEAT